MKLLFRIFLSLSFLLLNGFSNTYANSYRNDSAYSHQNGVEHLGVINSVSLNNSPASSSIITSSNLSKKFNRFYAEETEEENNKSTSVKKHIKSTYSFSAYYTEKLGCTYSNIQINLPVIEHAYFCSSKRYSVLQVFLV